ncbi:MAG: GAF domain-containing protein, partial [Deltaproteobacteria bacterium]|nr:GAF domain-containing protein [Deltaproteobacteria bacterium]
MADRPTELRLKELLKFYRMKDVPLDRIIDFVVEECRNTSASELAFVSFVKEDETIMDTRLWSCSTKEHCLAEGRRTVFSFCDAGLWGEAVRQKMTIIVNTCPEPDPCKKGYPAGHFPIMRFMAVPVVERGRAVLIAGLANKKEPYTESDEIDISFLLEGLWNLIQRRKMEEQYRVEKERLSIVTDNAPFGLVTVEKDGKFSYINPKFTEVTGYEISDIPSGKDWFRMAYPDASYRHEV